VNILVYNLAGTTWSY